MALKSENGDGGVEVNLSWEKLLFSTCLPMGRRDTASVDSDGVVGGEEGREKSHSCDRKSPHARQRKAFSSSSLVDRHHSQKRGSGRRRLEK